ncbi:MAG: hypothetical protein ACJ79A_02450 [Gemmatimonadaceae bacterium]
MIGRAASVRVLGALGLLATTFGAAPRVHAQRAGEVTTTFDPRSGRFGGEIGGGSREPDTLAASAERVWAVLPEAYAELGVPLTVVDTAAHYLGARSVTTRRPVGGIRLSRIVECGSGSFGPNAERYTVQLTLLSAVRPIDTTHSVLMMGVGGSAMPNGLSSSVKCQTNGALEEKLLAVVRARLAH